MNHLASPASQACRFKLKLCRKGFSLSTDRRDEKQDRGGQQQVKDEAFLSGLFDGQGQKKVSAVCRFCYNEYHFRSVPGTQIQEYMSIKNKQSARGPLFVVFAAILMSTGGICFKLLPWGSLAINGFRSILSASVMLLFAKLSGHRLRFNRAVAVGSIGVAATTTLYSIAVKLTTSGAAIVLQYALPVWTMVFTAIMFRKKPRKADILTCVVVLAGISLCFYEGLAAGRTLGNILALLSGVTYSFVFLSNSTKNGDTLSSLIFGAFISIAVGLPFVFREPLAETTPLSGFLLCYLGIVQIGIAYVMLSKGLETTPPVTATLLSTVEPVLNPIWVAVFYSEPITLLFAAGGLIVLGSVTAYQVWDAKHSDPPAVS